MITPRQITASNFPDCAALSAHNGISNDPGTRKISNASSAACDSFRASSAPATRRETSESFQRLATIAKRKPFALSFSSCCAVSIRKLYAFGRARTEYSCDDESCKPGTDWSATVPVALLDEDADEQAGRLRSSLGAFALFLQRQ